MKTSYLTNKVKVFDANGIAESLFSLAIARGADRNKLLHGTGIFIDDFHNKHKLSSKQILKLCDNAKQQIKSNDLSFQLGHSIINKIPNELITMLKSAKSFKRCLKLLGVINAQYFGLVSAHQFRDNTNQYIVLQDAIGLGKNTTFIFEAALAALQALSKTCLGHRMKCTFYFKGEAPKYIYEYEMNLGYSLNFSQTLFMIKIPHQEANIKFQEENVKLQRYIFQNQLDKRKYKATIIDKVRSQLRVNPQLSLPLIANYHDISIATFKRILKEHGTSFQRIEDELRCQQALYYLQIKKLKNEQSAKNMQFSDINNFRRVVKRLTGQTPSELRNI